VKRQFTLPVAHVNYTVRFRKVVKYNGKSVHGLCDPVDRVILIELKPNVEFMRQTIWHEFFHAFICEVYKTYDGVDETMTEKIADAVMRVRADVPWL